MKIGKRKLRMSSGEIRTFKSQKARDKFERVAQAVKHGRKPTGKKKKKGNPGEGKRPRIVSLLKKQGK